MKIEKSFVCFVCGKQTSSTGEDTEIDYATVFMSYGNYGSTLWDPLDENSYLEMTICDECLKQHLDRLHVVRSHKEHHEDYRKTYDEWDKDDCRKY